MEPRNPDLAVDNVVFWKGEVLLIERKNAPFGWALPGGFVDRNKENTETAAKRELKEETTLECDGVKLIGVYSEPDRDPRSHVVSIAYLVNAGWIGMPEAKDDAVNIGFFPIEALPPLAFKDHKDMISAGWDLYLNG